MVARALPERLAFCLARAWKLPYRPTYLLSHFAKHPETSGSLTMRRTTLETQRTGYVLFSAASVEFDVEKSRVKYVA